jgi:hypothetical protein
MKKRIICLLLALMLMLTLFACGKAKTVTCDHCGVEIELTRGSNITDEWIVYCRDCELELFGEDGVVVPG